MTEKKEYQEFRKILREALGADKQKDYAEKIGISPEHLNRLLNNHLINCPSKATLDQIIKASPWINASDIYKSCGYTSEEFRESIRDKIGRMKPEEQLAAGNMELELTFKALIRACDIYSDMKEMARDYRARFETMRFEIRGKKGEEFPNTIKEKKGTYVRQFVAKWKIIIDKERRWDMETYFALFFVKLDNGSLIITDIAMDGETLGELGLIPPFYFGIFESPTELPYLTYSAEVKRKTDLNEENLLKALFASEEDQIPLHTLTFGNGTIWTGIPDRFSEYILENTSYFSENPHEIEIIDEINDAGGYTEAVEKVVANYKYRQTKGPAAIAIAILNRKANGFQVRYDESVDDRLKPAIYVAESEFLSYMRVDLERMNQINEFLITELKAMGFHTYGKVIVYKSMYLTKQEIGSAQKPI